MIKLLWVSGCLIAFAVIAAIIGSSMVSQHTETTHTVSWFLAHDEALDVTRAFCRDNPSLANTTPDCVNSSAAFWQRSINRLAAEEAKH